MDPMITTILMAEKELELERQGLRRTRRFIGDANVIDEEWYRTETIQVEEPRHYRAEPVNARKVETLRKDDRSFFARLFNVNRTRREPVSNEC